MRRRLTDAEMKWAEGLHFHWSAQMEAQGFPVPPEPLDSVMQAAIIGMSRLDEATREAIEQAQRQAAQMKADGVKSN